MEVKTTARLTDLGQFSNESVLKIGKIVCEQYEKQGKLQEMKEAMAKEAGVAVETLTVAETDLFTTAISNFIEKRLRPELVAEGMIKKISNFNTRGQNAIKIPLRNALITATDLPDSGQVTYDTGSYESTTVTLTYKYAAQSLTHEIVKFANVDLIAEELGEIGYAIGKKVDADIIAAFKAATTTPNGNLTQLGSGTYVTFDSLVEGWQAAKENNAAPDKILLSWETLARIIKLGQFAGTTNVVGALTVQGAVGNTYPQIQSILGMKVVGSNQVDDDDIYMVDTGRTGYMVEAGDVEVFDGRRSGYLAYEVIGAKNYGIGIVQPKAIYRVEENA